MSMQGMSSAIYMYFLSLQQNSFQFLYTQTSTNGMNALFTVRALGIKKSCMQPVLLVWKISGISAGRRTLGAHPQATPGWMDGANLFFISFPHHGWSIDHYFPMALKVLKNAMPMCQECPLSKMELHFNTAGSQQLPSEVIDFEQRFKVESKQLS